MISLAELLVPQTSTQVRATLVTMLVNVGIPANLWRANGVASTILTYVAVLFASFTTLFAQAIGLGFLPTATGAWLALLAYYVYGVSVPTATFAGGKVTLVNGGGANYTGPAYVAGKVLFYNPTNQLTYVSTEDLSLLALGSTTIAVSCTTSGAIGSAAPGQVSQLTTPLLGVTCSNADAVVGNDAPNDATVRALCLNRLGASSVRGPRSAYKYAASVAVGATSGQPVNVNRVLVSTASHVGDVTVTLASPEGAPTADDVAGVSNSIQGGVPGLTPPFSGARPDGVTVILQPAVPVPVAQVLTAYAVQQPGLTRDVVYNSAAAALTLFFEEYPIGGYPKGPAQGIFATGIEGEVIAAHPAIYACDGGADVALVVPEVAVDAITLNVVMVPPP